MLLHLETIICSVYLLSHHRIGLYALSLYSIAEVSGLLTLAVKTFHPVLDLVERFLLPIESFDATNVESIANAIRLDGHVKR